MFVRAVAWGVGFITDIAPDLLVCQKQIKSKSRSNFNQRREIQIRMVPTAIACSPYRVYQNDLVKRRWGLVVPQPVRGGNQYSSVYEQQIHIQCVASEETLLNW